MNSSSRPLRRICNQCLSLRNTTTRSESTEVVRQHLRGALPPTYPPPLPKPVRLDPNTVTSPRYERRLLRSRVFPVGSRRRRAALQKSANIPFEQLPYQCFQEARMVLQLDREDKVQEIQVQRARIQRLVEQDPSVSGGVMQKENRLSSMRRHLEHLKVLADINDPLVKKRFEDGKGDMSMPIYRHLAKTKWEKMKKLIIEQRVSQMNLAPDLLPRINITADVSLYYCGRKGEDNVILPQRNRRHEMLVQPGQFVASKVSRIPPRLDVQVFDKGERFVTVAIVDPDVPNVEKDTFDHRCHFLAVNIPISPTTPSVRLETLSEEDQVILSWMPPYAIKGSPYHRLAVVVLQQPDGQKIDMSKILSNYRHHSASTGARPPPPKAVDVVTEELDAENALDVNAQSTAAEVQSVLSPVSDEAVATSEGDLAPTTPTQLIDPPLPSSESPTTEPTSTSVAETSTQDSATAKPTASTAITNIIDKIPRHNFKLRAFVDRHHLHSIGAHLFRTQWDIWMDKVMRGAGYEGAGTELRRRPSEKLPYKKKDGARYR